MRIADEEGAYVGDYVSGKYRLGGGWVKEYPRTLAWFNEQLEHRLFPALAALFPEIVRDAGVPRAHSVAMLKYNSSHPRTDVHTDNGILAMTLARERADYVSGGGTFYEHLGGDGIVEMDAGHVTLRPGSVRHGGHKVKKGERYILGAFLLIADRVEHVRRLNLQGSAARERGDAAGAARIFEWATKARARARARALSLSLSLRERDPLSLARYELILILSLSLSAPAGQPALRDVLQELGRGAHGARRPRGRARQARDRARAHAAGLGRALLSRERAQGRGRRRRRDRGVPVVARDQRRRLGVVLRPRRRARRQGRARRGGRHVPQSHRRQAGRGQGARAAPRAPPAAAPRAPAAASPPPSL